MEGAKQHAGSRMARTREEEAFYEALSKNFDADNEVTWIKRPETVSLPKWAGDRNLSCQAMDDICECLKQVSVKEASPVLSRAAGNNPQLSAGTFQLDAAPKHSLAEAKDGASRNVDSSLITDAPHPVGTIEIVSDALGSFCSIQDLLGLRATNRSLLGVANSIVVSRAAHLRRVRLHRTIAGTQTWTDLTENSCSSFHSDEAGPYFELNLPNALSLVLAYCVETRRLQSRTADNFWDYFHRFRQEEIVRRYFEFIRREEDGWTPHRRMSAMTALLHIMHVTKQFRELGAPYCDPVGSLPPAAFYMLSFLHFDFESRLVATEFKEWAYLSHTDPNKNLDSNVPRKVKALWLFWFNVYSMAAKDVSPSMFGSAKCLSRSSQERGNTPTLRTLFTSEAFNAALVIFARSLVGELAHMRAAHALCKRAVVARERGDYERALSLLDGAEWCCPRDMHIKTDRAACLTLGALDAAAQNNTEAVQRFGNVRFDLQRPLREGCERTLDLLLKAALDMPRQGKTSSRALESSRKLQISLVATPLDIDAHRATSWADYVTDSIKGGSWDMDDVLCDAMVCALLGFMTVQSESFEQQILSIIERGGVELNHSL